MMQNYSVLMSVYYKEKPENLEQAIKEFNHSRSQLMISYWYVTDH